jgi:hypothetical protein
MQDNRFRSEFLRNEIKRSIDQVRDRQTEIAETVMNNWKRDNPDWAQHYDMMEHQAKNTFHAPIYSAEDIYTDLEHALDKAKG